MRVSKFPVVVLVALLALPALAQSPTGTVSGRVVDSNRQGLPGVTVTAKAVTLIGERTAVTSANGDFILPFLPPGDYTFTFTLAGFQTVEENRKISAGQTTRFDVELPLATLAEEIVVTGRYETISTTTQASTTFEQDFIEKLPIARTIAAATMLSPGVSDTGPNRAITISGAMSYENLWTLNGVVLNENIRQQALPLFIEDAIQETTVSTAGVSAEYGRFAGGVITALTKSGGNQFSGSFRTSFTNDKWAEKTPLTVASPLDKLNKTYEATLGGRILRDRLWFFLAGRDTGTSSSQQTIVTNIPFTFREDETRYEGKLTWAINPDHRVIASYFQRNRDQFNYWFGSVYDMRSIYDRQMPEDMVSLNYSGAFSQSFFVEALYSRRQFTFENSGGRFRDRINGTVLQDLTTSRRFWAPVFCGVCTPEERDNVNILAKGIYFLSTPSLGTHDIAFGVDSFEDIRKANNHQSGSDFFLYLNAITIGQNVYARLEPNVTYLGWWPIFKQSEGTSFKTNSVFINDRWRLNNNFSFNIGVRYDKNDGVDSQGAKVVKDSKISPRLGVSWDPTADGTWTVNASYAKYVMAIANNQADAGSAGGQPASFFWYYTGPVVNGPTTCSPANPSGCLSTDQVLAGFWAWFDSIGGTSNTNWIQSPSIPGRNRVIRDTLASPDVDEITLSVTRRLGLRGVARVDLIDRKFGDFYMQRVDTTTGTVTVPEANNSILDLGYVENDNSLLERKYRGVQLSASYRMDRINVGGNYTWSEAKGNWDGETAGSGPVRSGLLTYPEYIDPKWAAPIGYLAIDQRHKGRVWITWDAFVTKHHNLNASLLHNYWSGMPYGAAGTITLINRNVSPNVPYIPNTFGYRTPPSTQTYYFTNRDAFRTDNIQRTDVALNYSFKFGRSYELFIQPEVLNVFNKKGVEAVDTTVRTRGTTAALGFSSFNPFTETPRECPQGQASCTGFHWQKGPNFGKPTGPGSYQTPRTFRISMGFRF
ncbi:MAG: TonB-dependent receptor [Acidobacteriota bacterium]